VRAIHFGLFPGGLILLTVILTGCSLLSDQRLDPESEPGQSASVPTRWVIAAQGEEEPAACEQDLSRSEARQEAKEALKEEEEAQQLQQVLAALGKRVMVWRAQGCEVSTEEEDDASAQGLISQQTGGPETVLVEVPAGADAALYMVETADEEGNYWVSLKESTEDGEVLTHIEVGLDGDTEVQGLSLDGDTGAVSFLLPNESVTQEIVGQVQQLLEGSETESAGVRAMGTDELDWSRAEVLLLDADVAEGEEVDALLVIPAIDEGAEGQALWGRTNAPINTKKAVYAGVKVKKNNISASSKKYQLSSSSPITRTGSTVTATSQQPLSICPYRYYGQIESYRYLLCRWWENAANDKIRDFLLSRSLEMIPEILSLQTTLSSGSQQSEQDNANHLLALIAKNKGFLALNSQDLDPVVLYELARSILDETVEDPNPELYTQQDLGSLTIQMLLTLAQVLFGGIQDYLAQQGISLQFFLLNVKTALHYFIDTWQETGSEEELRDVIMACIQGPEAGPRPQSCEDFGDFIGYILGLLQEQGFSMEEASQYLIELLMTYAMNTDELGSDGIVDQWGVGGVFLFAALLKGTNVEYPFDNYPGTDKNSILRFMTQVFSLQHQVGNFNAYLGDLLAAAMAFALQIGDAVEAQEFLAEMIALYNIFSAMISHGWRGVTYGVDGFDFGGSQNFSVRGIGDFTWELRGNVEGYLAPGEATQLFQEISEIVEELNKKVEECPYCNRYAYIHVLVDYDEEEKEKLCDMIRNKDFGLTPVLIVDDDGTLLCHSKNVTSDGAEDIMMYFGLGDGASSGTLSSNTYGVPIGDPTTGQCTDRRVQCLLP
jgi:hypothetical protein